MQEKKRKVLLQSKYFVNTKNLYFDCSSKYDFCQVLDVVGVDKKALDSSAFSRGGIIVLHSKVI